MSEIRLWNLSQLKNTVLWFLTVGAVSLFHTTDKNKSNYLKETLKDVLSITAGLQFLLGIYSFSLAVELILLPVAVLIGGMNVVAKQKNEFHQIAKVLQKLIMLAGLLLICHTLFKITTDFKSFANKGTLTDFLMPALLSILFLPMLYVLSIHVTHNDLFAGLEKKIKSRNLLRYARCKALIHFHVNKTDLYRWQKILFLRRISSKNDINESIELVKAMKRREKHPPLIEINKGWSPYAALKFLETKNLPTGFYHPTYVETEWMACSNYTNVDDNIPPSNIAYYVEGNEDVANKLTLNLKVHNVKLDGLAIAEFIDSVNILCKNALNLDIANIVLEEIVAQRNWEIQLENKKLYLKKEHFVNKDQGYNMTFTIKRIPSV
ncbi:hypothetical protein [Lacibacter cauensis]|uniref:hypothetical protein n=1 Tax=Lacibacter cauensis TaxID=510947 RepID=UPI0011A471A7|nr:hypothetical protein [Lacibacter cauensis]